MRIGGGHKPLVFWKSVIEMASSKVAGRRYVNDADAASNHACSMRVDA